MRLVKFTAKDPFHPKPIIDELNQIARIHGVQAWTIYPNGDVAIEYDQHTVSDETVEVALAGIGFILKQ